MDSGVTVTVTVTGNRVLPPVINFALLLLSEGAMPPKIIYHTHRLPLPLRLP